MQRPRKTPKKWTVMVFMGAATIEGEEDLLNAAEDDLLEMASVGSGPVLSPPRRCAELNIFVQVYAHAGPRARSTQQYQCTVRKNHV